MRKMLKSRSVASVTVLTLACVIVATLLGIANALTEDVIYENEMGDVYDSLSAVIDGNFERIEKPAGAPRSVVDVYRVTEGEELVGHAVTLSVDGYASVISLTVGVDKNGNVTRAVVTGQAESHGKPGMANYTESFSGLSKEEAEGVDVFAGATVSSTAIKNAVIDAINTAMGNRTDEPEEEGLPRDESEIISLASSLAGSGTELVRVTSEGLEYAKRIYKAGSDEFVVYTVVMSRYGYPETETLIYVDGEGRIKNINKLAWKTSDAAYGYVPPSEDVVNAFYDSLIGKDLSDISSLDGVDLVANATNTSTNLKAAITEGLEAIEEMKRPEPSRIARTVGIVILSISVLGYLAYRLIPAIVKRRKNDEQ